MRRGQPLRKSIPRMPLLDRGSSEDIASPGTSLSFILAHRRLRMVSLSALWLPILLSAVIVFIASSIMHMVLPYHRSDYQPPPDEDKVLAALRAAGLKRGLYMFPFSTPKEMKSPATIEKFKQGPVGMLTVFPNAPASMPKILGM